VATSTDDEAGEVAIGVRAHLPTAAPLLTDHALSWLVGLPFAGAVALLLLQLARGSRAGGGGGGDASLARWVALAASGAQLAVAVWVFATFRGDLGRADGNDGFQLVDRVVWIRSLGVEYFVGVDGLNVALVLAAALLGFAGVVASFSIERGAAGYFALYLVLVAACTGAFVALDLVLMLAFVALLVITLFLVTTAWGGARREYAGAKLLVVLLVAGALLVFAVAALHEHSDRTFLVDGTTVARSFAVPELARVSFAARGLTLLGGAFVKIVWVALFLGFAALLGAFPLHTWVNDLVVEAPAPVAAFAAGAVRALGAYGILRVAFAVLPEGTRWAAGGLVALGAVTLLYAALGGLAQREWRRRLAYASTAQLGLALVGLGSLTPQGIAGAVVLLFTHALSSGALLLVAGAVEARSHTRTIDKLGGLASEMPLAATIYGVATLAAVGLPGTAGFWGFFLPLLGAFPVHRAFAAIVALGAAVAAAHHVLLASRVFFGELDNGWRKSPYLEPFGGRFPELAARELSALLPLALLLGLLGLWPVPLLSTVSGGVRDATSLVNPPGPDQIALAP
jgi:NADH-quinone oxidoreductase subunit M